MIPVFPRWKPIALDDQAELAEAALPFLPSSDHSLALIWAWNAEGNMRASRWNGSIFLEFASATGGRPTQSLLCGSSTVNEAAAALLDSGAASIQLVPEQIARHIDATRFSTQDDTDMAEYLVSAPAFATFPGPAYAQKRRSCSTFERDFTPSAEALDLSSAAVRARVQAVAERWHENKCQAGKSMELHSLWGVGDDRLALERIMSAADVLGVVGLGVWVSGRLVAFTLSELLPPPYATVLFIKSDTTCSGVQDFIFRETARHLLRAHGRTVLNLEEDGGSEGLRRYKSGLRPFAYIRKYTVSAHPASAIRTDQRSCIPLRQVHHPCK